MRWLVSITLTPSWERSRSLLLTSSSMVAAVATGEVKLKHGWLASGIICSNDVASLLIGS